MIRKTTNPKTPGAESGAALLIAIFALLLISVVAIALLVSTGTDTALAGNYRSATGVYYAGLAGIEEGRGRMLWKNPSFINLSTSPPFAPMAGSPAMPWNNVLYIINSENGETVDPTNIGNPAVYPDLEYFTEFGQNPTSSVLQTASSVYSPNGINGVPGPTYKWIRVTPATKQSLGVNVDGAGLDNTLVYYDPINVGPNGQLKPSMVTTTTHGTESQTFQITALASIGVPPNNTQKMLQYVVTPLEYGLYFHAALTLPGSNLVFYGAASKTFLVSGNDGSGTQSVVPGCTPVGGQLPAVGVTEVPGSTNYTTVINGITPTPPPTPAYNYDNNYLGSLPPPSVMDNVYMNSVMSTPANLNNMLQVIRENADLHLTPPSGTATRTDMPAQMTATNPMTIFVDGNLSLTGFTGYGLLVVTGTFTSDANSGWKGVVLVVGSGNVQLVGGGGGSGEFDGAFLAAQIMYPGVTPPTVMPTMGTPTFNGLDGGGNGIYYSSCWVNKALNPSNFKILSFREIPTN
jgi:hypothetical protein